MERMTEGHERGRTYLTATSLAVPTLQKSLQPSGDGRTSKSDEQASACGETRVAEIKQLRGQQMVGQSQPEDASESKWVLWTEDEREEGRGCLTASQFVTGLHAVGTYEGTEGMCQLWNSIYDRQAFSSASTVAYFVFKEGIRPLWEDKSNHVGGHFTINVHHQERAEGAWLTLLLSLTTEHSVTNLHYGQLTGLVFKSRKWGFAISVWHRHSHNRRFRKLLLRHIKTALRIPEKWITYQEHCPHVRQHKARTAMKAEKEKHEREERSTDVSGRCGPGASQTEAVASYVTSHGSHGELDGVGAAGSFGVKRSEAMEDLSLEVDLEQLLAADDDSTWQVQEAGQRSPRAVMALAAITGLLLMVTILSVLVG